MSATIMCRAQKIIDERAERQALEDGGKFLSDLTALLSKHGVDGLEAEFGVAPKMAKIYTEARTARLKEKLETDLLKKILGE